MIISLLYKLFKPKEQKQNSSTSTPHIPHGILLNILSRVPAPSLLRFKPVNRAWYSLISSEELRRRHLQHHVKRLDQTYGTIQVGHTHTLYPSLSLRIMSNIHIDDHQLVEIQRIYGEVSYGYYLRPQLLGSCNGLLLISLSPYLSSFILWNPTIREHRIIDRQITNRSDMCMAGLGYNSLNDDYKIVVAEFSNLQNNSIQVQIYNLKESSWKTIKCDNFPYKFISFTTPAASLVNGIPHWHVKRINNGQGVVISFDLAEEKFEEIDLPENILDFTCMSALDGCLCIGIRKYFWHPIYVWKMRDYGIKKSWFKLKFSLHTEIGGENYLMPLGFLQKDLVVANFDRVIIAIFNVITQQNKFIMGSGHRPYFTVAAFIETFVEVHD
ncbi:F-box/kelch-repeat protein At3g06240-like [Mercurialis annua]|uniref:F-box/kelch-repeat protein At3g06240-like n=1 Tax=Mercurialis annua TaxID=3986 RepID=UPI00215F547B|nr:F-box/kelch-repeat protein At3g06240-like [Mercurialis annua]